MKTYINRAEGHAAVRAAVVAANAAEEATSTYVLSAPGARVMLVHVLIVPVDLDQRNQRNNRIEQWTVRRRANGSLVAAPDKEGQ